jgi:hypothetical protein
MNEDYIFYPAKDSPGGDICWAGNKSIPELQELCNADPNCIAFNTLGYMKYCIQDESKFIYLPNHHGMYVHKKRYQEMIKMKIQNILEPRADLTFVITTCKRLPLFVRTINQLLIYCKDLDIIKEWICIDDNSSSEDRIKMKELYPFLKIIEKPPEEKGHPESINILLKVVTTKYLLLFEDDWVCSKEFYLKPYLTLLNSNQYELDQIILCHRQGNHLQLPITLNNEHLYQYKYNHYHPVKPELNIELDKKLQKWSDKKKNETDNEDGWWWPGISYNPGIWKMKKFLEVGNVRTDMMPELFEYDHSLKCYERGLKVAYTNMDITHIGFDNSAYKKNGFPRYYEV